MIKTASAAMILFFGGRLSKAFAGEQFLNVTALWGLNKYKNQAGQNTALLEASYRLRKLELYTRYEWVQKFREELNLDENLYGENTLFPVNALTFGLNYDLSYIGKIRVAAGGQLSAYYANNRLDNLYEKIRMPVKFSCGFIHH